MYLYCYCCGNILLVQPGSKLGNLSKGKWLPILEFKYFESCLGFLTLDHMITYCKGGYQNKLVIFYLFLREIDP